VQVYILPLVVVGCRQSNCLRTRHGPATLLSSATGVQKTEAQYLSFCTPVAIDTFIKLLVKFTLGLLLCFQYLTVVRRSSAI